MYINPINKKIYRSVRQVRQAFPTMSLPTSLTDQVLDRLGLKRFFETDTPEFDENTSAVEPGDYIETDKGMTRDWIVRDLTPEELANKIDNQWQRVRDERNDLLAQTDYLVMPDYVIDAADFDAVTAYRAALRDITDQEDPFDITWPVWEGVSHG